ncbi:hypothetical protein A9C11_11035 [Pseudomonas citronellolis]|uniref:Tape measure protein N-terminal domain-containing protein n=1 Tax=Pseudomonas citronellolis TaxID=53408 RepID=A0A1A9KA95_9PSED|nr:tape measure protein [Pseudomonas citronellolis]ANI14485.1 hypothetical protein A9C11_11035 [Pseudomonas citronellolis]
MSEKVGEIYYTVEADTAKLLDSSGSLDVALRKNQASMGKTDAAADRMSDSLDKAANSSGRFSRSTGVASQAAKAFEFSLTPLATAISGLIAVDTLRRMQEVGEEFSLLQARIKRLSSDTESAAANYQSLLAISSRTGTVLGNSVKLWENLTLTIRELGGTDAQVLRLAETLQKIGAIGGSSSQEMTDALRQFGQSLSAGIVRAEEFNSIVEGMPQLAREIANGLGIPFGQLRQELLDGKLTADRVLTAIQKRSEDVDREFSKLPRTVGQAANALSNDFGNAVSALDRAVKASQTLARWMDLIGVGIRDLSGNRTEIEQFNKLIQDRSSLMEQLANQEEMGASQGQIDDTKNRIAAINAEIKALQDRRVEQQKGEGAKIGSGSGRATGDAQSLKALEDLKEEAALARLVGEERAKAAAIAKLGAGATQEEKDQASALAVEIYRANEGRKQSTRLTKEQDAAQKKYDDQAKNGAIDNEQLIGRLSQELAMAGMNAEDLAKAQAVIQLNPWATPEQIAQVKALAAALYQVEQAKANKQLLGQVDPIAGENQAYQTELENLKKLNDAKLLEEERYQELRTQAEQDHDDRLKQLEEERFRRQSAGNELIMATLDDIQQAGTNAMVGLITGANNGKEAMQQLAGSMLNQVVGALVKIGIEQAKNFIMGQAQAATATATAVTSGGAITAAMAPAAATASIATFGGAVAAGMAALAGVAGQAIGLFGGRQYGGSVAPGGMYRINENGAPEVFNAANGRQYMLPNSRGEVVSNRDAAAGSSPAVNVSVNLHEDASRAGQVTKSVGPDGEVQIDAWVANLLSDGKTSKAISQAFGLKRRGT